MLIALNSCMVLEYTVNMQLNTVTLATGNRFFIIEDFFEPEQYNSIVELFDQYGPDHPDWFADHIDLTCCVAWATNLNQLCRQQQLKFGSGGHFLEAGHQLAASMLWDCYTAVYNGEIHS
jgi:hypothetical protein